MTREPLPPARRLIACDGCPDHYPEGDLHVCGPPPGLAGVDLEARLTLRQWSQEDCARCGKDLGGAAQTQPLGPVFDRVRQPHMLRACAPDCGEGGRA
ncbi:hypothetical protein RM780_23830 [Streptomyces sp. DSM 44917]|uniref:Uncharacterized protein n=1 Tax=Streptomyces boetiae TaxID=3075541 RepID=A0ABU2LEP9_9ACTN|nr:hypothetical protein [Streptomyces sp. DSM 44917]MDT0309960.1 hypothetical protein [Streptomyces sp. DSM 44917]